MRHANGQGPERRLRSSLFLSLPILIGCLAAGCNMPLPAWVPAPLREPAVRFLGFVDSGARTKSVSSDEVDGKLPPNSVSVNQEILKEMVRAVFLREPASEQEFSGLLDVLNQGASFEGVYNGLVHSTEYRRLEDNAKPVLPATIQRFAEEMAILEMELPVADRALLNDALSKPLPKIVELAEADGSDAAQEVTAAPVAMASPTPSYTSVDQERAAVQKSIEETFLHANVFTMKRVIGSELFKVVAQKRADRNRLADWYAQWCVRVAKLGVDFGYAQRSSEDLAFHTEWAWGASTDRLQWEMLLRIHRLLNEADVRR